MRAVILSQQHIILTSKSEQNTDKEYPDWLGNNINPATSLSFYVLDQTFDTFLYTFLVILSNFWTYLSIVCQSHNTHTLGYYETNIFWIQNA